MKTTFKTVGLLLFIVFFQACSTDYNGFEDTVSDENIYIPEAKPLEQDILNLINEHRQSVGLSTLQPLEIIKSQTFSHTDYMRETYEVSHANFFSRKAFLESNTDAESVFENVAYGFTSAENVVAGWLASDDHKNIVEGNFTHFEISAEKDDLGKWYYTNIFIRK